MFVKVTQLREVKDKGFEVGPVLVINSDFIHNFSAGPNSTVLMLLRDENMFLVWNIKESVEELYAILSGDKPKTPRGRKLKAVPSQSN